MTDDRVERSVGFLLRAGVMLAAAVVGAGGILYLWRHGHQGAAYGRFHGVPAELRAPGPILAGVAAGSGRALIQLGLVLLIATPVARVIFSVAAFALERDWLYVSVTLVVLAVLIYSLMGGH